MAELKGNIRDSASSKLAVPKRGDDSSNRIFDLREGCAWRTEQMCTSKRYRIIQWSLLKDLIDKQSINTEEQIDRNARGPKLLILRELCVKEYSALTDLMSDAQRIEAVFRRSRRAQITNGREDGLRELQSGAQDVFTGEREVDRRFSLCGL